MNIAARAAKQADRVTPELVAEHGLSRDEYQLLLGALGREPSLTELGIFSVMWSEHCSYKSSKVWLKKLPTEGEHFTQMPVPPQLVMGIDADVSYPTERFTLPAGASMLLYTDGVTDAIAAADTQRFMVEGLQKALYGRFETAQAIIDAVVDAVDQFRGEKDLPDDVTLVAIQLQASAVRVARTPAVPVRNA